MSQNEYILIRCKEATLYHGKQFVPGDVLMFTLEAFQSIPDRLQYWERVTPVTNVHNRVIYKPQP